MVVALGRRDEALLTITEAAEIAGVHRNTIRAWCASGRLGSVRVNRRGERRVRRSDVDRLVSARAERSRAVQRAARRARHSTRGSRPVTEPLRVVPDTEARTHALRRIATEVSASRDLATLLEDVLDDSVALFGVDRAGLWHYGDAERPFRLAIQRGVPAAILDAVEALRRGEDAAGVRALETRTAIVHDARTQLTAPSLQAAYRGSGIASVCFVPIVFRDEPLGLLALYHDAPYDWSADEIELARSFGDGLAIALGNARLAASAEQLTRRLHAIQELAIRLNRIQDVTGIGQAIVSEAGRLIEFDTIRVYRVDPEAAVCEAVAFEGRMLGSDDRTEEMPRVPVGVGLTGWVAANNAVLRTGDAARDPRGLLVDDTAPPESMLIVPMSFEQRVHGVIVVSRSGVDAFDDDDETTLSIFAGYAAQAVVNAEALQQVRLQRAELEHQLASQRRLLEVNERLLSTLDPQAVLELIADSLKAVVAYDSLTIYRVDRPAGVRRAVVARDRYAELILLHAGALDAGITGWCIANAEAVLSNDAHLDPRSIQIPGTPEEPESMIVVPLQVHGEVIGTLNLGRIGGAEAHFSRNEFELTKLFAGQASIALQNAEAHGEVRVRADHDALTGLRNHGAFQRELGDTLEAGRPFAVLMMDLDGFKVFNDTFGHPAGDALLASVATALRGTIRDGDRVYRYGGDEFAMILPGAAHEQAHEVGERIRRAVAALPPPPRVPAASTGVTISVGVACAPQDGRTKDALVGAADQALYLVKPSSRTNDEVLAAGAGYLNALDETAIALMQRLDPTTLLETITTRAAHLLGTPHGYLYLVDEDEGGLVCRIGTGVFATYLGNRMEPGTGIAGRVLESGAALVVDDYDSWPGRAPGMPAETFGAVVGVPLTSGGRVIGVIGLASADTPRTFGAREIAALNRFAQLASIALDNAQLADAARRGTRYDTVTGLPNRELLTERMTELLDPAADDPHPIAVILLDLDRFKVVNESLGHDAGDVLLAAVGRRLEAALRPGDAVTRFGGDAFGIVLDPIADDAEARRVADRIAAALKAPFDVAGRDWFISASMGIAVGAPGKARPGDLLREAEIALVRAKGDSTLRHRVFEPAMSDATRERVDLENDLRRALERDELRLHYQPILDLASGRIVGVEALVRWEHPERGLMLPLSFVPLAEETGLIVPLGQWVLSTACRQATEWQRAFPDAGLVMSVNLSAREFAQPDLTARVAAILAETGLAPGSLELEITESIVMDETEAGSRTLAGLRELGVAIALDDFGTGYSSLSYLKHLPLDTLKIDRSFVTGLGTDASNEPIVSAVISLAHGLRMDVVAEGIETDGEARRLVELGCDRAQGYRWARPLPPEDVERLLRGPTLG